MWSLLCLCCVLFVLLSVVLCVYLFRYVLFVGGLCVVFVMCWFVCVGCVLLGLVCCVLSWCCVCGVMVCDVADCLVLFVVWWWLYLCSVVCACVVVLL